MLNDLTSCAVAIMVETLDGIPLVSDPKKPTPRYWKFPGGRGEAGESPEQAASRELKEETGIQLDPEELTLLHSEKRKDHNFFLFHAKLNTPVFLLEHGSEGENIKLFKPENIMAMPDFFPNHKALIEKFLSD